MSATDPETGEEKFFIDKCLPFGVSISCSHFHRFSNALRHVFKFITGNKNCVINYLDDFLFVSLEKDTCDFLVRKFIDICNDLGVPIAKEKTKWGCSQMIFLGILIDGPNHVLAVPEEKRTVAITMFKSFINRRKATVKDMQRLSGHLNF